ncbi:MAG: ATP-binding cassette domain-containing protein [Acidobacteriota bacterium]|mgnify:CR=1 FL=1
MTPVSQQPMYALRNLRHRYGNRVVLDIPQLDIHCGETLAIVGPSGAGKSTLLRLLQFLEHPSDGHILFDGTSVNWPAPLHAMRRVTTVFQRSVMLDRSVRRNVEFGMALRGRPDAARVDALLRHMGLAPLAAVRATSLSGGEIQRVALARAVMTGAEVLLLDEPAANLDPANVGLVESAIRELQGRGTTLVIVTHNTHEARRLSQRALVLLDGLIVEDGPTAEVFDAPHDPRTRAFLSGDLVC